MIISTAPALGLVLVLLATAPAAAGQQKPVAPVTVVPPDINAVARMKLEDARAALTARQYDTAGSAVLEVIQMSGVSDRWRAHAFTIGCDLGMRTRDWELAKTMCERVLPFADASKEDRLWSTGTLKALRQQQPGLFR